MVSAVKVGGRRLHELARQGLEVERPARAITVSRFDVDLAGGEVEGRDGALETAPALGPLLKARIECSSGTYVRVLAADLGMALGGGAHVRQLRRTSVGPWTVDAAVPLEHLDDSRVLAPFDSLPWIEAVVVDAEVEAEVRHGRVLPTARLGVGGTGPWRVASSTGELLAIYQLHGREGAKPAVVAAPEVRHDD